jgi:hypothetical protein
MSNESWEYTPTCPSPVPPTNTTPAGNLTICSGNSTTLSASGTGILGWYSAATGGIWLGGGTNYTTPILTTDTTYYVQDSTNCGASATRTSIAVTVNPIPLTPVINNHGDSLFSSAPAGNQWYFEGNLIPGATGQIYIMTQNGWYWDIVTLNGCSSDTSNHIFIGYGGIDPHSLLAINIYPVPNDGMFNVSITAASEETFSISIYNTIGVNIYQETNIKETSSLQKVIDLRPVPRGVYTLIFKNSQNQVVKKIMVNK